MNSISSLYYLVKIFNLIMTLLFYLLLGKMVREFIAGWDVMQILGEGTFAEVKLLVNRETGEACAMKEVNMNAIGDEEKEKLEAVKKEICLHKLLNHQNVVRCWGARLEEGRQFIFLEYCEGGELFDRIEPEVGMEAKKLYTDNLSNYNVPSYVRLDARVGWQPVENGELEVVCELSHDLRLVVRPAVRNSVSAARDACRQLVVPRWKRIPAAKLIPRNTRRSPPWPLPHCSTRQRD